MCHSQFGLTAAGFFEINNNLLGNVSYKILKKLYKSLFTNLFIFSDSTHLIHLHFYVAITAAAYVLVKNIMLINSLYR
jgi:hypothetical protein